MKPDIFIKQLDHGVVEDAIAQAEARTSGEIRVAVAREAAENPVALAEKLFGRLGMEKTAERNGVLILIAPVSQTFAIVGDRGIHEKCGATFWTEVATAMSESFAAGDFTQGVRNGISRTATLLAKHFPRRPDDRNELANRVVEI